MKKQFSRWFVFLWILFVIPFGAEAVITLQSPYVAKGSVFKGQMHTHSKCVGGCSDGSQSPAEVAAAYRDAGYDFISITDHNTITPIPNVSGMLIIPGIEDTMATGHLNRINAVSPTVSTPQGVIDLALREGSFVVLNHPNYPANPIWTDARLNSVSNYHGIEVWNSVVAPNQNAEGRIDRLLSEGKKFYLVAADDCHHVSAAYCKTASVRVFSDNLTVVDIMANLKSGNFYASNGANISKIEVLGQTIRINTDAASKIEFIGEQGMILQSGDNITNFNYTAKGNEKYIRARVTRKSDGKMAWANPIYVSGTNQPPIGYFDYAKCDNFVGWTCDADDYSKPLDVHFYYDGPVGTGKFVGSTVANVTREAAVGNGCGGKTAHGFKMPSPDILKDGQSHKIYAYAINTPTGSNPLLTDNPKTIQCGSQPPIGYFDYAKCDNFVGWTCDADDYSKPLDVHFYYDGPVGTGKFVGSTVANVTREAAVGNGCGGKTAHGFKMPSPDILKDGQSHKIYAYAINNLGGVNPLLGSSTMKCSCVPGQVSGCRVCKADGSGWQDDNSKCATGQYCDAGVCKADPTCVPACTQPNAKQCSGNGYQICALSGGCLKWGAITACTTNQTCQNGACVNNPTCTSKTCAALGNYQCGDWSDGCGKTINCGACSSGKTCNAGKCASNCLSRASKKCDGANLYWYNSCNNKEELAQNCETEGNICRDSLCVSSGGGGGGGGGNIEPKKQLTRADILVKIQEIKKLLIQLIIQLIAELQKQLAGMQK
jgi:hypothetical protein